MILVTGGAGYIGSHTVQRLNELGEKVIVLDNLYSGFKWAVPQNVKLVVGDVGDVELVKKLIQEHKVDSVIHFAAHLEVEESVKNPFKYYQNNVTKASIFINACYEMKIKNFIFSSTCAAYGNPPSMPVVESMPSLPLSPYGKTKFMTENFLWDMQTAFPNLMKHVILRYFNVAGANIQAGLGQATPRATQLVKVASEVAQGKRPLLKVFGTDYPTLDGTCIRDYVHVQDLAEAHILALNYLKQGGVSDLFNCGYGTGYSVLQVIESMKKVTGIDFKVQIEDRRAGDAEAIYADPTKIKNTLGWKPQYEDIDLICRSSFEWEKILDQKS